MTDTQELAALYARLDDLTEKSTRGEVGITDFLSPRECALAEGYLGRRGTSFVSWGGYAGAERRRVYLLPDYMSEAEDMAALSDYGFEHGISALGITHGGYRQLSHRDYLGSVLGLGIKRNVIGDILVAEDGQCTLFCDSGIKVFLLCEFSRVANDKVKVRELSEDSLTLPERRFLPINDTVASARLDCVVGALCSLSRDKAKQLVISGAVEISFVPEERPDRVVEEGAMLSVRGFGRYRIISLCDKTRKGRYRLVAEKFI